MRFLILVPFLVFLIGCQTPVSTPTTPAPSTGGPATPTPSIDDFTRIGSIPQKGDQGGNVEVIQTRLNANGASLTVDGDFGSMTAKAISDFQKKNGLEATGILDTKTLELLKVKVGAPTENGQLPWENGTPERRAWSVFVQELIGGELYSVFDNAEDARRFCPNYNKLDKESRVLVWSNLIAWVAKYESGWDPTSGMTETTMGLDPVTGKQVRSEGLLQLSYQDVTGWPFCKFDWSKDKGLALRDPRKTILDPYKNLDCGIRILAQQIRKRGTVILTSNVYWSVLKEGGKYSEVENIVKRTRTSVPNCG